MSKSKSCNSVIIEKGCSLFKNCHVTQIIADASLPPTPSFLHFTPAITPPPSEGISFFYSICYPPASSCVYLPWISLQSWQNKQVRYPW